MDNDLALLATGPIIAADQLEAALGWTLKPEGLCRDDTCVIVKDRAGLEREGGIDVTAVASLLDRPVVIDEVSDTVAVGAPRAVRRQALDDLIAPDFVLPDLDGAAHRLSDHRSKKRLLVTFASW